MSIYSFNENAPVLTTVLDADIIPINSGGKLSQITAKVLQTASGGTVTTTSGATVLAVTQALHGNRTVTLSNTGPIAITLPTATGTGTKYRFVLQVAATATQSTIKVGNSTDVLQGLITSLTTTAGVLIGFNASATSDTISLNGTTTGGGIGGLYEITDIKSGIFHVVARDTAAMTTTPYTTSV